MLGKKIAFLGVVVLFASAAEAQELCDGRVCPEAFTCETYTSTCPPEDPGCEVFTETYCKSPECVEDRDCPAGMRCRVERVFCDTAPPAGAPPECRLLEPSSCHPAYELPCKSDTECGTGFTCEPACDCSDPNVIEVCDGLCLNEEQDITGGCYTPVRACTVTADCPSGWTCADNVQGLCNTIGDLHTGCNPGDPPKVCLPPMLAITTPSAGGDDGEDSDTSAPPPAASDDSGGCSLSGAGSARGQWLLGLALILGIRRRRRSGHTQAR